MTPVAVAGSYQGPDCGSRGGVRFVLSFGAAESNVRMPLHKRFEDCHLTVDQVLVRLNDQAVSESYMMEQPLALGLDFASAPSMVLAPSNGAMAFYANARIGGLTEPAFDHDFVVELLYSDNVRDVSRQAPTATYVTQGASAAAGAVPPPDYLLYFWDMALEVDTAGIVQNSSRGWLILWPGVASLTGEEWKLFAHVAGRNMNGFAAIDSLFREGATVATGSIFYPNGFAIHLTQLGLLGWPLPATRDLIIKHTGQGGVASYQVMSVLFPAPIPTTYASKPASDR